MMLNSDFKLAAIVNSGGTRNLRGWHTGGKCVWGGELQKFVPNDHFMLPLGAATDGQGVFL